MLEIVLATAVAAGALSNFPRDAGGRVAQPAIGVTLGGRPAVLVAAGDRLTGFHADGSRPAGLPLVLPEGDLIAGAPAAADMDGDRRPEVAVVSASGRLWLWGDGGTLAGFPRTLGARARAGPSFVDLDGDGRLEVVVGDERGRLHAFTRSGRPVEGWPRAACKAPVTSTASSAGFDGGPALAVGCENGKVEVLRPGGRGRTVLELSTDFAVSGAPVFADLDDDGSMDLVVASQDFRIHAVDAKGVPLPGFPVKAGYRLYEGPAIADLDGDGSLDVVFASADGVVHAVDHQGRPLPGFPVQVGPRIFGGPAVGDLDRDGALDVAVAVADGTVAALTSRGKPLPGFPASLGEPEVAGSPLLYDLAGDGSLSVFVGLPSGQLHALRAARAGASTAAVPWPSPGRDAARTGRYGPNPPRYRALELSPPGPRVGDALSARWKAVWLDASPGQAVPAPRLEWLRNGRPLPELEGKATVPAGTARRGERWAFRLTPPAGGEAAVSAEVLVLDTPPGAPTVRVEPERPARGGDARVVVARPAVDPDGDPVTYRIDWLLDGLETGVTGERFPGERLRRGALLTARVIASDGELDSTPAHAEARVANTPPGEATVSLEPGLVRRTDGVWVRVVRPATDPDGDALVYRHRWTVDGVPVPLPLLVDALPAGLARKHQVARVEVRAFDGVAEGPPTVAEVKLRNTPPTQPRVELRPASPRKGQALRAVLVAPSEDADGDRITYQYAWTRNGARLAVAGDGREVPRAEVTRGDRFEVTVSPSDGEEPGPKAMAVATVVNTPPEPPRVAIEPRHPRGGEPLRVTVLAPATDADGDQVRLGVAWTREGKPTGDGGVVLPPTAFAKHERVRVLVTPHDGIEAGDPAADEVTVANAPPGAPTLAFPAGPTVTQPMRVTVTTPAADPDGDPVRYRYRWRRNGAPVLLPGADGTGGTGEAGWTDSSEVPARLLARGHRWEVESQAFDGETHGPSGRAEVTIANAPPPPPAVALVPAAPRRVDGLAAALTQPPDPDGDHVSHRFAWTRNGQRFEAPPDQGQVPRGLPRKGELWAVQVTALDGELESAPVRVEARIADAAPGVATIELCDGPVPSGTTPAVRITRGAEDPDGDPVSYRYEWTVNGRVVPGATAARLAAPLGKHDVARVQVTPWDGELAGPASSAECAGRNTPPTPPSAVLDPPSPTAITGLTVRVERPSGDHDGDAVSYRYAWSRDGVPVSLDGPTAPPRTVRHGEAWRVEVIPSDGEAEGPSVVLAAVIGNTPPPMPSVVVRPLSPTVGQPLACEATVPDRDTDREPVTVRYRWLLDGEPVALAEGAATLAADVIRRGERWRCEAWAWDGFAESGRASAEVVVQNSPPGQPQVVIEPEPARTGDELTCRVSVPSTDPDGDPVGYGWSWWRNEKPLKAGPDPARLPGSAVTRGSRIRCAATPTDGTATGPAMAAELTVANSPPGPVRVRLSPEAPRSSEALRCQVTGRSEDPDGDEVRYRFRWQRNGTAQPFAETSEEVPARILRAGDRWRCRVVPTDGDLDGPEAGSEEVLVRP